VHLGLLENHRQRQLDVLCEFVEDGIPANAPLIRSAGVLTSVKTSA
jgi:endonuclease/exonuclease/phosphatase family metal-dependent hydrolase